MTRLLLLAIVLLTGCATPGRNWVAYHYRDCDRQEQVMLIEERVTPFSWPACVELIANDGVSPWWRVAMWVVGGPIGCTHYNYTTHEGVVILPVIFTDAVRQHELSHISGMKHPDLLPVAQSKCEG